MLLNDACELDNIEGFLKTIKKSCNIDLKIDEKYSR